MLNYLCVLNYLQLLYLLSDVAHSFLVLQEKGKDKYKQKQDRAETEPRLDDVHMATLTWGWPIYMFCYMSPSSDTFYSTFLSMACMKE